MKWLLCASVFLGLPCHAQVEPVPSREHPRVQVVNDVPGQPIRIAISPQNILAVVLPMGEQIQSVTVGDTSSYQVVVANAEDGFFVRSNREGAQSNAIVSTDKQRYTFDFYASDANTAPYLVYFSSPQRALAPPPLQPSGAQSMRPASYKLSGNKALKPSMMRDDGNRTYIQWSADQAIPAVFAVDRLGREEMVNGYMREGQFTIDRVHDHLLFRIDKAVARAWRIVEKVKE